MLGKGSITLALEVYIENLLKMETSCAWRSSLCLSSHICSATAGRFGCMYTMTKKSVSQPRLAKILECLEKCLYHGSGGLPCVALFGVGADMMHLELQKRCLTVDVIYSKLDSMDDEEFLSELENSTFGSIFAIRKFTSTDKETVNKGNGVRR